MCSYSKILLPTGTMDFLPMHDMVTSCSGHLENTDSLNYAHFLNVTFYYTVSGNHDQYHRGYHQKRLEVLQNCQAHGGRYEFSKILIPA